MRFGILALCTVIGCSGGQVEAPKKVRPTPHVAPGTVVHESPRATKGELLRLKMKPGAVYDRRLTATIVTTAAPGSKPPAGALGTTTVAMQYKTEVLSAGSGVQTVKITSTPLKVEKPGASGQWVPQGEAGEITMDERGAVLTDIKGMVSGLYGVGIIPFPEKAVAKGSSWSSTSVRDMPPFGEVEIEEKFSYVGDAGDGLYRIDSLGTGSLGGMKISAKYLYRRADGSLHSADVYTSAEVALPGDKAGSKIRLAVSLKVRPR
ncbi:MAG TPA: hypothetical protein VFG65_07170 [Fimbriimonadales bacterium]|jgi:hypothetical protein|nr:hypothetical protein [Fimbriimonadales bacterium]